MFKRKSKMIEDKLDRVRTLVSNADKYLAMYSDTDDREYLEVACDYIDMATKVLYIEGL